MKSIRCASVLLCNFKKGKTASESHQILINVFGEGVITTRQYRNLFKRFQDDGTSLKDYKTRKMT